ncbi:MAG: sirohydrochlorin nickelochelatase [Methanobacteriaceae archaeon]|uniref:sirohydrochlorin nickelochelatase n=1 Tax=Methanobrevibacter acididurans TaxID=120963 RepID=UPI00375EB27A|nr:sirohydrochlorin nickelochelatase [Methanobacteriaceae archaeon]MDD4593654.1 sirohydrochlorin nickelochelatase [Methanobacteriaceae archaeon]
MSSDIETGILLLSHGSRLNHGEEVINELADMYRKTTNNKVEIGFMEMRKPNIPQAVANLTDNTNIQRIIVVPVFIAHGLHTKRDIPKILGLVDENLELDNNKVEIGEHHHHAHNHHHDIEKVDFDGEIIFTDPLGADPLIVKIIQKRVDEALHN